MMTAKTRNNVEKVLQDDRRHWHFEKRLSVDTLVGVVGVALVVGGPVLFWGRAMENRVLTLENINVDRVTGQVARDIDARDQRSSVYARLEKIEDRMTLLQLDVTKLLTLSAGAGVASLPPHVPAPTRR